MSILNGANADVTDESLTNWKTITLTNPKMYKIDYDKINSFEDMKILLSTLLGYISIGDNIKGFDKIKHLLHDN